MVGCYCQEGMLCARIMFAIALLATTVANGQPNDDCADAMVVGNGVHAFSTVGATTDGPAGAGCQFDGQTYEDIWYEYTATCTAELTLSTCSTVNYDSDLAVYNGCDCNNLVLLGCNDDGPGCSGFSSEVTVQVTAGNCYLLRIGGWNPGHEGSGTFSVQCGGPAPIGACCLPDDSCQQILNSECDAASGVFQGVGTPCIPNPCSGACCAIDGTCLVTSDAECGATGGIYFAGLACNEINCVGACCILDGSCQILSESQCEAAAGEHNAGALCESVDCEGACCLNDDSCVIESPIGCAAQNGQYNGNGSPCTPQLCEVIGPDVVYTDVNGISGFGPVGGVRAYILGSDTCNIGDQNLLWTNNGTPGLSMNMYRLHNGRIDQIGLGFLKTACCAAAGNGCGLGCNGNGGNVLGAGCLDVYGSGWNSSQGRLASRSSVNGFTGNFSSVGVGGSSIAGRCQVAETSMSSTTYPGALYFVEGHYIASDDQAAGNGMNNASYRRVTVSASFGLTMQGPTQTTIPAIYAWRDHGGGVNVVDPAVEIVETNVPAEGRFIVAAKALDVGGGEYRYTYSVFNINSDRSGGSFSVPIPSGAIVTNVGFNDVNYHSGDPYDNTDWNSVVSANSVTWSSPQTFAQNPNSNALRYSTMYTYWFTANLPPTTGDVTIGLFKPGTPSSIAATVSVPSSSDGCGFDLGDVNEDGAKNGIDVANFTECILTGSSPGGNCACADMNAGGGVELGDVGLFVTAILAG